MEEEELNEKLTRRVQREARRQHHQQKLKRHRMAQEIQRQLQEVEVKQRELENRGVVVEKALRGEGSKDSCVGILEDRSNETHPYRDLTCSHYTY